MMVTVPLIVDVEGGVNDMLDRDGSRTPIQHTLWLGSVTTGEESALVSEELLQLADFPVRQIEILLRVHDVLRR